VAKNIIGSKSNHAQYHKKTSSQYSCKFWPFISFFATNIFCKVWLG